jgi:hypothetical protein
MGAHPGYCRYRPRCTPVCGNEHFPWSFRPPGPHDCATGATRGELWRLGATIVPVFANVVDATRGECGAHVGCLPNGRNSQVRI